MKIFNCLSEEMNEFPTGRQQQRKAIYCHGFICCVIIICGSSIWYLLMYSIILLLVRRTALSNANRSVLMYSWSNP